MQNNCLIASSRGCRRARPRSRLGNRLDCFDKREAYAIRKSNGPASYQGNKHLPK